MRDSRLNAKPSGAPAGNGHVVPFPGRVDRGQPEKGNPLRPERHWTINGDFLSLKPTGVARYGREVTRALDALMQERHPLTIGLKLDLVAPCAARDPFPLDAIATRLVPGPKRLRLPQYWVQALLPGSISGGLLSFCNLAPIRVRRQIVCIHDLHTKLAPDSYGLLFRWAHHVLLPIIGRRAARVTTVSQQTRQNLIDHGIADPEKIVVTYNGSDHAERWDTARATIATSGRPYVLCLGRGQRYKNMELVLALAPHLAAMGVEIWMAGDVDPVAFASRLGPGMPDNLRLLGRISDDDLFKALSGAISFLFPSRIEGFGLPAVEAMVCGCPVVASTAPSLPEVCGEAALYADPDDVEGWAAAVRRLIDDRSLRRRLEKAGRERARLYSWRNIAEIYLEMMVEIDSEEREAADRLRRTA